MDNSKHLHTTLNSTGLRHLREMVRNHYVQDWVKVVLQVPFSEMPIEIIFICVAIHGCLSKSCVSGLC